MMSDLIRRKDANELVNELRNKYPEAIEEVLNIIKFDVPAADEWIPCTEKPKQTNGESVKDFLVTESNGSIRVRMYAFEPFHCAVGWITPDEVIAWQPLPKPYKAG